MEVKGKILAKKGDNKAFKLDDGNWYNLNDNVIPYLEKMNKGDEIVVTFEKKGISRYVSKLTTATTEAPKTETTSTTGFACEVCGKELKDGKFKKCFLCNKNKLVKTEDPKSNPTEPVIEPYVKKEWKTNYGSPEDIAGKEVGCSLGAAATVASGQKLDDPEVAKQYVLLLAEYFLDWMRAKK
jgi:hypothetical protein